ncbi:hypothetical protein DM860_015856 [Cuscuta australis]|uniref:Uncharacterized protein n=1 Tax=Cuscuta australis TaxID=267555 RepID=A0A328E260_9ASTE|nr:hypothetical protein DM860_015856 [Cuscuta australis]
MPMGCTADGILDESKYSEPMPWIGIYVAVASAACAAAMAGDAFHGLRYKKLWFPCNFFSLNATTLALVAVATKLSVDLNSSMPRHGDQLAKLSSGAFVCTVMSNFMPSLGAMKPKDLAMNLMAWGIFVITVVVNIGIQLGTGVIYAFWEEHVAVVFVMIILLLLLVSSALSVPTTKSYFDLKYSKKYNKLEKRIDEFRPSLLEGLRDDLMTYWMMALTCSPQFVVGRSVTCTASGAFCLLSMVVYAEAMLRSYLLPRTFKFCNGESDYKWSTGLILVAQTIAILIGTIAPAFRWLMAIEFQCPKKLNNSCHNKCRVEDYWIQSLVRCKESPLDLRKRGRWVRKIAHSAKEMFLDFCIGMQRGIVGMSKLVRLVSLFWVRWILIGIKRIARCCHGETMESRGSCSSSMPEDLRCYILHLEGEEALMDYMMSCHFDVSDHWIKMGKKKEPKNLTELLRSWTPEQGFLEANRFDSDLVPSLDCENEPPNCWALPVVTLASIAMAVSSSETDHSLREQLMKCVEEAMVYVRFLEEKLDRDGILTNLRKAAQMVWVRVDLHYKWLDLDLIKMGEKRTPGNILKSLSTEAKQRYIQYKNKDVTISLAESPLKWPTKILAANSMYRICQSLLLLQTTENQELQNSNMIMFERLSQMIRGIVGACLTNLPHVICTLCHQSSIEERGKSVRLAITLLGKVGKILEIVSREPLPSGSGADRRLAHIDDWRALSEEKGNQLWNSCPAHKNNAPRGCSSGFYITIE